MSLHASDDKLALLLPARHAAWAELAEQLDLTGAPGSGALLCGLLNLEARTEIHPLYAAEMTFAAEKQARLYMFDYIVSSAANRGRGARLVSGCVLNFKEAFANVSLKASRKAHQVLESLQASASGSYVVTFPNDEAFASSVSVYARDVGAARQLLSPRARGALTRALHERGLTPTFLLGEKQLVLTHSAEADDPTPLATLEQLSVDLLSFYGALSS